LQLLKQMFANSATKVTVLTDDPSAEKNYVRTSDTKKVKAPSKNYSQTDIIGDSHIQDFGPILNNTAPEDQNFYAMSMPGANTLKLTHHLNRLTSHLQPDDNLVFMAGSNDVKEDENEETTVTSLKEAWIDVASQCQHTNLIICTIPLRYDKPHLNEKIKAINASLIKFYKEESARLEFPHRLKIIEINSFLKPDDYNFSKFHLSLKGKTRICNAIRNAAEFPNFLA